MRIKMRSAWVLATVLGLYATGRAAGPLDNRVPQDAMAYVGWAGADALQGQYTGSNLKGVLDASAVKDLVMQHVTKFLNEAAQRDPNAPKQILRTQTMFNIVWHHPTAFYFCPMDFSNPQMPGAHFGFICDAGDDSAKLVEVLNQSFAENPPPPPLPVHVVLDGKVVIVTLGQADTPEEMKKGGGLAASPAYQAAMNHVKQATPAVAAYGDFARAMAMVNDAMAKIPNVPPEAKLKIQTIIDVLGVNSLTQFAMAGGFDGKAWSEKDYLGINGPRKGLLSLLDTPPLTYAALAAVPKEASVFAAWKLDLPKAFAETRAIIGKIDAQSLKEFDSVVAATSQSINVDVEKALIGPLGDEWVLYRAPISDDGGSSFALVHKLRDGDTFIKTLAALETLFNSQGQQMPFKVEKVTTGKVGVSTIALGQYSVAWTVKNGTLYVSTLAGVAGAVKQVENKSPSIVENDLYKAAVAGVPANAKRFAISYANPAKVYPELRRTVLGFLPIFRSMGVEIPKELLPDTDDVAKFMTPGADVVWSQADGVHRVANSAFPGAETLSGQQIGPSAIGVVAVGAAVALPNLARQRQVATVTVDASNLRGISQSCMVYASDHKDEMPDDLARLVAEGMLSPRQLTSRRVGTVPLEMSPDLQKLAKDDFTKFSQQIAEHNDFIYLGKGTKMDSDAAVILAYEKPGPQTKDGLNLAFRDGHVEFMRWNHMTEAFAATNDYLKKNSQPPVDVKDMMKKAGVGDPGLP